MTPTRTIVSARPGAPSTTPTPHLVSPGSTPSTRIGCRAYDKPTRCSLRLSPRTSVRLEPTGPRAVRGATPAACPLKGVEHVGRGGKGGVQGGHQPATERPDLQAGWIVGHGSEAVQH